jgi:hypothetical protein
MTFEDPCNKQTGTKQGQVTVCNTTAAIKRLCNCGSRRLKGVGRELGKEGVFSHRLDTLLSLPVAVCGFKKGLARHFLSPIPAHSDSHSRLIQLHSIPIHSTRARQGHLPSPSPATSPRLTTSPLIPPHYPQTGFVRLLRSFTALQIDRE